MTKLCHVDGAETVTKTLFPIVAESMRRLYDQDLYYKK